MGKNIEQPDEPSLDPRNDRICYYEGIIRAFVDVHGFCNIRGAAEKIVQMEEKSDQPVDWSEDAAHENGNYSCKCTYCGVSFIGHKRRVICARCAKPPCPDIEPIRKLAREVGYSIGEHGSKIRDYDIIAAPWTDEAVDAKSLVEHLCKGLNARVIDEGAKPHGRYVYIIQLEGRWLKHIDLSILPITPKRESVDLEAGAKAIHDYHHFDPYYQWEHLATDNPDRINALAEAEAVAKVWGLQWRRGRDD